MKQRIYSMVILVGAVSAGLADESKDIVIADFEGNDYGEWKATGDAFGVGPAHGTMPQGNVEGFVSKGLVNSFNFGSLDDSVGTLTSPDFKIERKFINFLIGGGNYQGRTCREIEKLHDKNKTRVFKDLTLRYGDDPLKDISGQEFDIRMTFDPDDATEVAFNLRGTTVTFNAVRNVLSFLGKEVALTPVDGKLNLQILVDRTSIEVFGNDGMVSMASLFLPLPSDKNISLLVRGGPAKITSLEVNELMSAWDTQPEK